MSNENDLPPFMTARAAARLLGYSPTSTALTRILRDEEKRPEGAYKAGRYWMVPTEWVLQRKAEEEEAGIIRGGQGRPVTSGAGKQRKDRGGSGGNPYHTATGNPPGRPKKSG